MVLKKKILKYLMMIVFAFPSASMAKGEWSVGAGLGFVFTTFSASGTYNDGANQVFENDEKEGSTIPEFFFNNSEMPSLTYVTSLVNVNEVVSVSSTGLSGSLSYNLVEVGVVYDLAHSSGGWFLDVGYRKAFSLGGQQVTTFSSGHTYASGQSNGYDRIEIGVGKIVGNVAIRFAMVNMFNIDGPEIGGTGVISSDITSNDVSAPGFSITYWC